MTESILNALYGGALIGLAASILLVFNGRVAGISGILGGLLPQTRQPTGWRLSFLIGLVMGGIALILLMPDAIKPPAQRSWIHLSVAGLLVGYGTQLGNGCTSGHGVCGISRLSIRSIAATLVFIAAGIFTATAVRVLSGGGS
jgi:uncharacterized protein